jgi:class 3 adenylate cyclase/tetratricopeptide (TPR) repeat protein
MVCAACKAENEADARFCEECGAALALACPSCGAPHAPGKRFCKSCGASLVTGAAPAVVEAAAVAEMRVVSVLFVDLVGYTTLSESRDAEDVRELLSRYFDTARTIVGRYGGVVEKFIGDAVMAVWGTPTAREDDAERAVRAGLELVAAVTAFGEDVGAPELRARAGVVTGQVAALANPGEGLVVGDRVNTASRVQSTARPGTVFVDEVTRRASSAVIAYEDAGEHAVKGKLEPLRLWRAVRVVAGAAGLRREEGLEAPFVGRDAELRLVKDLFHATVDRGTARLVAVSGPAGVGKSRLRHEFILYTDGLADTVLWHGGRCLSYGDGVTYWALAEMVRQRLGIPEETTPEAAAGKLAAGLERWVTDPAERAYIEPRLGALLGTAQPGLERQELFAGWRLFFERLADHEPVVLAFEDLQWADEGLLDFIEHVLDWSARRPIFIFTFARPELAEARATWAAGRAGVTPLYLDPLADRAVGELLDGLVSGLPARARERIVAQAEGIPLYALETVRALADRGALREGDDGRLVVAGDVGELDVPSTLSSLLTARLDALPADERALVKDLAVLGGSFPRTAVTTLSSLPEDRIDEVLASLVRKQVLAVRADPLSPDRGQYAFAQALLRNVAYDLLSRKERKPRHLAVAEHLRTVFANDGEEVAEVIAAHYLDAYEAARDDPDAGALRAAAADALRRAARRAETVGAPESAERAYRSAGELARDEAERAELTEVAGQMAVRAGRYEPAIELLQEAADAHAAAGRQHDVARVAGHIGMALRFLGRGTEAIERIRAALEVLDADRLDPDVAMLNLQLATTLVFSGRGDEGLPALERALRAAEALALPNVLAGALTVSGVHWLFKDRFEQTRGLFEAAVSLAERNGLNAERMRAQTNLGWVLVSRDSPEGESHVLDGLAAARRLGDRGFESVNVANLMHLNRNAGRWHEVDRLAGDLPEVADRPDDEYLHHQLTILSVLRGDLDAARDHLAATAAWETTAMAEEKAHHAALTGAVALAEGRVEEALEHSTGAVRYVLETLGISHEVIRQAWPDAIDAALAAGRLDDAAELVSILDTTPVGHVSPLLRALLPWGRGRLAAARGEHDGVEADLTAAVEAFRELGYPHWLARAQTALAGWLIERNRLDEAIPHLDEAGATLERLGAMPALARVHELRGLRPSAVEA